MNTAAEVLLIIVSATLALFLLIGIVVLIKLLQLVNTLKRIADTAEKLADSAEAVGNFFRKTTGPVALGTFVTNMVESVVKHKRHKE